MKYLLFFLILIVIVSCNSRNDKLTNFNKFCNQLESIKLPQKFTCSTYPEMANNDLRKFSKFIPQNFIAAGKIETIDGWHLILYHSKLDTLNSLLYSFSLTGNEIDRTSLHLSKCEVTTRLERSSNTVIGTDLSIVIIDSFKHFSFMEHGTEYIRSLDSVKVSKKYISIDDAGKFKKRNAL